MKKVRRKLVRENAVIAIYQYLLIQASIEEIKNFLKDTEVYKDSDDYQSCLTMIEAVMENKTQYESLLQKKLKKKWVISRLAMMEQAILFVATAELLEFDGEKEIVVNEAVELAKKYCDEDAYKYINGVLYDVI